MSKKPETKIKEQLYRFLTEEYGGYWIKMTGSIFQQIGVPDIIGFFKENNLIIPCFIEVKTQKGMVSKIQDLTIKKIRDNGGCSFAARSIEDIKNGIEEYKTMLNMQ